MGKWPAGGEDPEQTMDRFMQNVNRELGQSKAEMAAVSADASRAQRALEECRAEIRKLQRYAEKAAEAGNEADAAKFLGKKAALAAKETELQAAYDAAASNAAKLKQQHDKLEAETRELESRQMHLKGRLAAAKAQQSLNELHGGAADAFDKFEEQVNTAYDEAMALAELRAGRKDDLDEQLAQLEKSPSAEDKEKR